MTTADLAPVDMDELATHVMAVHARVTAVAWAESLPPVSPERTYRTLESRVRASTIKAKDRVPQEVTMSTIRKATVSIVAIILLLAGLVAGLGQANASSERAAVATTGSVVMVDPCRVADSRTWVTLTTFWAYETQGVVVGGHCGVPANAAGAILNVTVVPVQGGSSWNPGGYLTVYPLGGTQPEVSQVTYNWNNTTTEVTARLGNGGGVAIFNGANGMTDVIVDVAAYIAA